MNAYSQRFYDKIYTTKQKICVYRRDDWLKSHQKAKYLNDVMSSKFDIAMLNVRVVDNIKWKQRFCKVVTLKIFLNTYKDGFFDVGGKLHLPSKPSKVGTQGSGPCGAPCVRANTPNIVCFIYNINTRCWVATMCTQYSMPWTEAIGHFLHSVKRGTGTVDSVELKS